MKARTAFLAAVLALLGAGAAHAGGKGIAKVPALGTPGVPFNARVAAIVDGDSFMVKAKPSGAGLFTLSRRITVRLPVLLYSHRERGARSWLAENMGRGSAVTIVPASIDAFGRVVGDAVFPDGRSLSSVMTRMGFVWHSIGPIPEPSHPL